MSDTIISKIAINNCVVLKLKITELENVILKEMAASANKFFMKLQLNLFYIL